MSYGENEKKDFIFRPSKDNQRTLQKTHGGEGYDAEKHKELLEDIAERDLDEKFQATVSAIEKKEIKDSETIYFVIEIDKNARESKRNLLIEKLSARVHDYLDEKHTNCFGVSPYKFRQTL